MNAILKLITTDEQRMAIIAELLMDEGLMFVLKNAIMTTSVDASVLDPERAEKSAMNYELLYNVLDGYLHPEQYED